MHHQERNLLGRLGGHDRHDPAGLAGSPQANAVGTNVMSRSEESRAGQHVPGEGGKIGLLPVAGGVAGAPFVVTQDRKAERREVARPGAEYIAG